MIATPTAPPRVVAAPAPRRRRDGRRTLLVALMAAVAVLWVLPIAWIAWASVTTSGASAVLTFQYYGQIFSDYGMLPNLINSITVTTFSTVLALLIGTPAAFALSRYSFRGSNGLMLWFLSTRMSPPILVALPYFLYARAFGIDDTVGLLIAIYTVINTSWVIFMMRSYFDEIPREIDEAAAIDGASPWRGFRSIVLPLARPGLVATAIFCIITSWNEYLFAVVLTSIRAMTLPATLTSFLTVHGLLLGPMAAASVTVMLPILLLALWMQKHLIRGMAMGAVK
jgi:ABC-type glycerol-3-phosphate transport system permease component